MEQNNGSTSGLARITLITPFDIGESYVFKVPHDLCEKCIWKNIFSNAEAEAGWTWNFDRLGESPAYYLEPFGRIARYRSLEPANAFEELDEPGIVFASISFLEVIFFTRGIGLAVLTGDVQEGISVHDWRTRYKKSRDKLKELLKPIMSKAQKKYTVAMGNIASRKETRFVSPVKLPGRMREIDKARFTYAIGFTAENFTPTSCGDEVRPATVSKRTPLGYSYTNSNLETPNTQAIDVGWGETTVYNSANAAAAQNAVVDAFVVAMASWFVLVLMSSLVSKFLRDVAVDVANDHQRLSDREGQKIRFAFMDAANASRPVRWTFRERDMLLLDRIHETWSTKRWWRSLEERTVLLADRHSEVAEDIHRNAEKKIAFVATSFGIIAFLSVAHDLADAIEGCHWLELKIMSGSAVFLVLLILFLLKHAGKK